LKDLTTGKTGKQIFQFALPMLMGNVFQQLYNVVDTIVVGKGLGKEALAAVGANFPYIFVLISFVVGIAMGATVIISQFYGAKQTEKVKQAVDTLYIFMFFAALFLTILGRWLSAYIFTLIELPPNTLDDAVDYFNVYAFGFIFFFGFQGTSAVLRGLGDSKTPFYFLIISTVTNIILDVWFVFGLKLGIKSVAAATVISQGIAFIAIEIYLNRYHKVLDFSPFKMKFNKGMFLKSMKIGLPVGFQQTFVSIGFLALYRIVNVFGTSTIAAYAVAMRIDSFAILPAMNFSAALSTFTGQNIGACKLNRIGQGLKATLKITLVIAVSISILEFIFAEPLMYLFTDQADVVNIGKQYIYIVAPFYFIFTAMFVVMGLLRGAGDTMFTMILTLISLWIIRIPASYWLSLSLGTKGIWWGIPLAWFIGALIAFLYYFNGKWKTKSIINCDDKNS
jgi:putative MATE family efflux protein